MTSAIYTKICLKLSFLKTSLMWERKRATLVIFRMCKRYKNPYIFLATCHVLSFNLQEFHTFMDICRDIYYVVDFHILQKLVPQV